MLATGRIAAAAAAAAQRYLPAVRFT